MPDVVHQITENSSEGLVQATGNWAEEFVQNRLIPLLEHLPFVSQGAAEQSHWKPSLALTSRIGNRAWCLETEPDARRQLALDTEKQA